MLHEVEKDCKCDCPIGSLDEPLSFHACTLLFPAIVSVSGILGLSHYPRFRQATVRVV